MLLGQDILEVCEGIDVVVLACISERARAAAVRSPRSLRKNVQFRRPIDWVANILLARLLPMISSDRVRSSVTRDRHLSMSHCYSCQRSERHILIDLHATLHADVEIRGNLAILAKRKSLFPYILGFSDRPHTVEVAGSNPARPIKVTPNLSAAFSFRLVSAMAGKSASLHGGSRTRFTES
jgi:hypothetical protein